MMREFEHRNLILNSRPTYVGDRKEELRKNRINSHHLLFSTEGAAECLSVMRAFSEGRALSSEVRRVGKRKNTKK